MRGKVHKISQAIAKVLAFLLSWVGCYQRIRIRATLIKPNTRDVLLNAGQQTPQLLIFMMEIPPS